MQHFWAGELDLYCSAAPNPYSLGGQFGGQGGGHTLSSNHEFYIRFCL
jgi:hypothetical protein